MRPDLPSRRLLLGLSAGTLLLSPLRPGARAQGAGTPPAAGSKIGIIGSGNIGSTLGTLWVKAGHSVLFSSRHPENLKGLVDGLGASARAGTPAEAAAFGDAVLVAVPYGALPQVGREVGPALAGKVVLDACNAVAARDGDAFNAAKEKGIGRASAGFLPGTRLVRAFNTLNFRVLQKEAHRAGEPMAIPIAGDDAAALQAASALVRDAGFEPVVVGSLDKATEFAMGARGYGQQVGAKELRERLGLPQ